MESCEYQLLHFQTHPPRCLSKFVARPTDLPGAIFDGHSPISLEDLPPEWDDKFGPRHLNPIFELGCRCGEKLFFVHGYRWSEQADGQPIVFMSPLTLECISCGTSNVVFDSNQHGYDAEFGYRSNVVPSDDQRIVFECERCGRQPLHCYARFELRNNMIGEIPEFAGREQDLFSWFTLAGRCLRCSELLTIGEFECA